MTTPQLLGERYEIGGVLGRGGMAEVHRGRDLRLGREVAVKVLRQDLARDPSAQVRFRREAQASASLNHPAIVAVYDTGEDRGPTGNTPYIVMEYVEGETLRDVIRREGHLDPVRAMSLTADICAALDFSHRNGIVHRDVKPGNVMITPQGTVKVMDFGIARAVSDSAATMTSTAAVIGTAQYLSPEQARGEGVDARSDVYSAGCLLYELVTGTPPFTGDSPVAVAYQHVREDPKTPSSLNPEIPASLDAVLLKAMSKNPANRYQSAADMRADLLRAIAGERVEATPVMSDNERTALIGAPIGATSTYNRPGDGGGYGRDDDWGDHDDEAARRRKRRGIIAAVVGAVLVLAVVIGGIVLLNSGGKDPGGGTAAGPTKVTVPADLVGQTQEAATATLQGLGLTVTATQQASSDADTGKVLSSNPVPGTEVDEKSAVALVVGSGPDALKVPNLTGLTQAAAQSNLKGAGFTGSIDTQQGDSLQPRGTVISSDPAADAQVPPDTDITLTISTGTLPVPDVVGRTAAEAAATLKQAGFTNVQQISVENDDVPRGTVAAVDPSVGSNAAANDEITLQIADPTPPQTTTTAPTTTSAAPTGSAAPTSGAPTPSRAP